MLQKEHSPQRHRGSEKVVYATLAQVAIHFQLNLSHCLNQPKNFRLKFFSVS